MDVWHRILRYLLLWRVLLVVLCVISVIRHWDALVAITSETFSSYLSSFIGIGVVLGLIVWGIRILFRGL